MKVAYIDCLPNLAGKYIIDHLKKEYNWQEEFTLSEKDNFNNKNIDLKSLRLNDFSFSDDLFDFECIDYLLKYEKNFLSWIEDSNGFNFSYNQRLQYYYDLLKFWYQRLKKNKVDLIVSFGWPHTSGDYSLYLLSKHYFKIPFIYINPFPYFDLNLFSLNCDLHNMSLPYMKYFEDIKNKNIDLPNELENYLGKMQTEKAEKPNFVNQFLKNYLKEDINFFTRIFLDFLKLSIRGKLFNKNYIYFKKNRLELNSKNQMNNFDYMRFQIMKFFKNRNNVNEYNKLVQKNKNEYLNDQYVLFAAGYQPEAISNIFQGKFENYILILEQLDQLIPNDWYIYYKEHPAHFLKSGKGFLARNKNYYKRIKNLKKIKFLSNDLNTYDLIDKSKFVVTSGGTIGWEALIRKKKVMVFGDIWYKNCEGVTCVENLNQINNFLNNFKINDKIDPYLVNAYALSIYKNSIKLNYDLFRDNFNYSCTKFQDDIKVISKEIFHSFKKFYN